MSLLTIEKYQTETLFSLTVYNTVICTVFM